MQKGLILTLLGSIIVIAYLFGKVGSVSVGSNAEIVEPTEILLPTDQEDVTNVPTEVAYPTTAKSTPTPTQTVKPTTTPTVKPKPTIPPFILNYPTPDMSAAMANCEEAKANDPLNQEAAEAWFEYTDAGNPKYYTPENNGGIVFSPQSIQDQIASRRSFALNKYKNINMELLMKYNCS